MNFLVLGDIFPSALPFLKKKLPSIIKKYIQIKFLFLVVAIFLQDSYAYAYLEPGTFTMILQFIVASIAAVISYVIFYYQKIKKIFLKIFKIKKKNKDK